MCRIYPLECAVGYTLECQLELAVEEDAADRGGLPWLTGLAGLGRGIQDSESRETSRCHCNVRGGFNGSGGSKAAGGTIPSADKRCTGASAGSI